MKKLSIVILMLLHISMLHAQSSADFNAALRRFQQYFNNNQADSIYNMLSLSTRSLVTHEQNAAAFGSMLGKTGKLESFELTHIKDSVARFKSTFEKGMLTIKISLNHASEMGTILFSPYKEEATQDTTSTNKSDFSMKAGNGTIYGTFAIPRRSGKVPVVLIIAGSGPTDRNCNSGYGLKSNAFKMLADSLQKAGIASLRYDKRGVGESVDVVKDELSSSFDDLVSDASAILKLLKSDVRFSKVFVMGHSEGSLVGILAAGLEPVDGLISLSGAGESVDKVIVRQMTANSPELGKQSKSVVDSIKKGYTVTDVPPALAQLFRPSVQPFLRSWMRYNPATEIRKIKTPVLIVQGKTDLQVSMDDAQALHKARPDAKLVLVNGMNHVLKQAPLDRNENFATYNSPELPLSNGFIPEIVHFVQTSKH